MVTRVINSIICEKCAGETKKDTCKNEQQNPKRKKGASQKKSETEQKIGNTKGNQACSDT